VYRRLRILWKRPDGMRQVLLFSLPLIISSGSWAVMHFVDRMFLSWHSIDAMTAALPAGMVSFLVVCFPLGLVSYTNTFVAQYFGAGRYERIGPVIWQGAIIAVVFSPLVMFTYPLAPLLFGSGNVSETIVGYEIEYYQILCFGAGGIIIGGAFEAFFTGRGMTRIVLLVNVSAVVVNIGLDALWIFGLAGFPEAGLAGAAWATVVAAWFKAAVLIALSLRKEERAKFNIAAVPRLDWPLLKRLARFGAPSGFQFLVDMSGSTLFIVLVKDLGDEAMAATNLAFNVNSFAFMPMVGLGIAASTLVGQRMGQQRPDRAARAAWSAFMLGMIYMGAISLVYVGVPKLLFAAHGAFAKAEEFQPVCDQAVILLRFVAAYCVLDAAAIIFSGALKGAGDTRFIFFVSAAMGIMLVAGTAAALQMPSHRLYWCWSMIMLWVWLMGMIFLWRFMQGKWREMTVMEGGHMDDSSLPAADDEFCPLPALTILEPDGITASPVAPAVGTETV
jgi:MATE family multidrug resistance protein